MYEGVQGKEYRCIIAGHCRTQIFEFPRIHLNAISSLPYQTIYESLPLHACIVLNLVDYFTNGTRSKHYAISPSLRHAVGETYEKVKFQYKDAVPVFIVVEENNMLTPVEMTNGECSITNEVGERDGKKVPYLIGGREGKEFITAWHTADGAWPILPNNQQLVNLILAGIRAGQETPDPIRKYLDQNCLVTDDDRFVVPMRPTMSARAGTATVMDAQAYQDKVSEIRNAIISIERDMKTPHIALLINSMYREEYKDDAYQRLHYLRLWESLAESGEKYLSYQGNVRMDNKAVAGKKTLRELKDYRDDIAHWWTESIDENFLADLQRTINELIRRKYF